MTVADPANQENNASIAQSSAPQAAPIPRHVAIIMDGNGRWAEARQQTRAEGHSAGVDNIRLVLKHLEHRGVEFATVFAFSTENWGRPEEEVSFLLNLLREALKDEVEDLHRSNVRILHMGNLDGLPPGFKEEISAAIDLTAQNSGLTFIVAFNYGGRAEIVEAVRRLLVEGTEIDELDEEMLSGYIGCPGVPDPDLVIRTGGEFRISNFLLWQSAYSEFYSTPAPWPDFDADEIDRALTAFAGRQRRFGKIQGDSQDA